MHRVRNHTGERSLFTTIIRDNTPSPFMITGVIGRFKRSLFLLRINGHTGRRQHSHDRVGEVRTHQSQDKHFHFTPPTSYIVWIIIIIIIILIRHSCIKPAQLHINIGYTVPFGFMFFLSGSSRNKGALSPLLTVPDPDDGAPSGWYVGESEGIKRVEIHSWE